MVNETSFRVLMDRLAGGQEDAAERIVQEYTASLVAVARRKIGTKLARRIDPEDVVQSAYRSFFVRMGRGEYELGDGQELWKLLLTMTLTKTRNQGRYHRAQKRNVSNDESTRVVDRIVHMAPTAEPSPEDAAMLIDEVVTLLGTLREADRPVVELRLQGYNSVEIAKETGRAERSVRRVLERVKQQLTVESR